MENVDLKAFAAKLLQNWIIIILCCIVGAAATFVYSEYIATPMYSSSVKIHVYNSDWSEKATISQSDISASELLLNTYIYVLRDDYALEKIVDLLQQNGHGTYSSGYIRSVTRFSQIANSQLLQVSAVTESPKLSAVICNGIAAVAPDVIEEIVPKSQIKVIGEAKVNNAQVTPDTRQNVVLGVLISLLIVVGIIFLIFILDNTVSDEKEFQSRYSIPVLGNIPNFDDVKKGNYGSRYGNYKR